MNQYNNTHIKKQNIGDYFIYPEFKGTLDNSDVEVEKELKEEKIKLKLMVKLSNDKIIDIKYQCTTCVTLVAYCEKLCALLKGKEIVFARNIRLKDIINFFTEVPSYKHNKALLVYAALQDLIKYKMEV